MMTTTTPADIYAMLKLEEGDVPYVYDDHNDARVVPGYTMIGHPTIGVGRALDVDGLSPAEIQYLLTSDVNGRYADLCELSWFRGLDPIRRWAVTSMAFVLGVHGVETFIDMILCLGKEDWAGAQSALLASKWAGEEPARAKRVAGMLLTGNWPTYVTG